MVANWWLRDKAALPPIVGELECPPPPENISMLQPMVDKLQHWRPLSDEDRDALLALPYRRKTLKPREYMVREGDKPQNACLILSGFAFRHKVAGNGGRQI